MYMGLQVDFGSERIGSKTVLYHYIEDSRQKSYTPVVFHCLLFNGSTAVVLA